VGKGWASKRLEASKAVVEEVDRDIAITKEVKIASKINYPNKNGKLYTILLG
jgi:hypothetical protein